MVEKQILMLLDSILQIVFKCPVWLIHSMGGLYQLGGLLRSEQG